MKTLNQLRAVHALKFWSSVYSSPHGTNERLKSLKNIELDSVFDELFSLIYSGGLIQAVSISNFKGQPYQIVILEIAKHLIETPYLIKSFTKNKINNLEQFAEELVNADTYQLRQMTDEAIQYLAYLKNFRTISKDV
jgi:hypothetical protein